MNKDVIIIGGGMVGSALALGLAKLGLNVALLEKNPLPTVAGNYDLRISAISAASIELLQSLGAWQYLDQARLCDYDGLSTWEIDGFETAFSAQEIGLARLGVMLENNLLQNALWQALERYPNCTQAVGFQQLSATRENDHWLVEIDEQRFSAPLVIAADGAHSQARAWAGIGLTAWDYRQHCLLATVETELPQQSITWQQFFPSGPRAFLPLADLGERHCGCVVWYDSPERIQALAKMPSETLSAEIMAHFPPRLGKIRVQKQGCFPLTRRHAQHYFRRGVVLVGDAAHTINPLAGQGVNLGFKDVKALLEVLQQAVEKGENFADDAVLARYERRRKPDNLLMQSAMDLFYKTFKTDLLGLKVLRNFGLLAAEKIQPLKKRALKYAIGL